MLKDLRDKSGEKDEIQYSYHENNNNNKEVYDSSVLTPS